ncbi:hypothetical protein [Microbacterium sp.]|uniref:hypothetical protein n=1 Tax=Microbacterium sp. TaxID=51671 RepID=UPI003A94A58D
MDSADLEELRALRVRAYGPAPDIADDPVAVKRLAELEAASRTPAPSAPSPPRSAPPLPAPSLPEQAVPERAAPAATSIAPPGPPPPLPAPAVIVTDSAPPPVRPAARRWYLSRGFAVLWAASLVAVAAIVAVVTFAMTWVTPIALHANAGRIATLSPVPDFSWPTGLFGGNPPTGNGYEFHGLTVMSTKGLGFGTSDADCLIATDTSGIQSDPEGVSGPIWYGCGAGDFPATVQLSVDDQSPKELRDVVPEGRAVQFVLDGDQLVVFSDAN